MHNMSEQGVELQEKQAGRSTIESYLNTWRSEPIALKVPLNCCSLQPHLPTPAFVRAPLSLKIMHYFDFWAEELGID